MWSEYGGGRRVGGKRCDGKRRGCWLRLARGGRSSARQFLEGAPWRQGKEEQRHSDTDSETEERKYQKGVQLTLNRKKELSAKYSVAQPAKRKEEHNKRESLGESKCQGPVRGQRNEKLGDYACPSAANFGCR